MRLSWYILNSNGNKSERHLRARVRHVLRHINESCLTYVCEEDGETTAQMCRYPRYNVDDLEHMLHLRGIQPLFRTVYAQLLYLQRCGQFIVTPATMDAIDVRMEQDGIFLLGVPTIDLTRSLELGNGSR